MKRMSFTNSRWTSLMGRSFLLALFAICFTGLQTANAQVTTAYNSDGSNSCTVDKVDVAKGDPTSASERFTDDGDNDGNYNDSRARIDTTEICPPDEWHRVKVVFTAFDLEDTLAPGTDDVLEVYQGNKVAVRAGLLADADGDPTTVDGVATGVGVSEAFGGWVYALCDPADNPSGCLTFILRTDGDNRKGRGFDAWYDADSRGLVVNNPNINSVKLTCADSAYAKVMIPAATVTSASDCEPIAEIGDSVRTVIKNQHGHVCVDTVLSARGQNGLATMYMDTFAIGSYSVEYTLRSDDEKTNQTSFSVQAPSLVCNDDVIVPLGSACMIVLTPDDVLEAPCDTIAGTMYYDITITLGSGKNVQTLTTSGVDDMGPVAYPVITVDDVKAAGMTVCNATATVNVKRVYYGDRNGDDAADIPAGVKCDNGTQTASCNTTVSFSDQSIPWITVGLDADTLIACDTTGLAALLDAKAIDNCDDDITVTYSVEIEEVGPCFEEGTDNESFANITFSAIDDCGNEGTATRRVLIIRPDKNTYIDKTDDVTAECDEDDQEFATPGLMIGTIKNGEFTQGGRIALSTTEYICGYILTSRDIEVPATDCGRKIYRYWSVLDWCAPETGPSVCDTTFIEYTDSEAPDFLAGEGANLDLELGHFSCTYDINKITEPKAEDNCDDEVDVRLDQVARIEDGATDWLIDPSDWDKLDCDSFQLRWIAEDDCHEQLVNDTLLQTVVIKDVTKPSAVCTDQLNISLPNEWGARVNVADVDAGSYDACGIAFRGIRIKGTDDPYTEYVNIGCEHVHPDLQLEMQIIDNKGNENVCWLDVLVEDKIKPICNDLDDVEDTCDKYHDGELGASTDADGDRQFENSEWTALEGSLMALYNGKFGRPDCEDNLRTTAGCGELTIEQQYQLIEWPCGEIEIRRRYRATDWSGNVSDWAGQEIKIIYKANWTITLPNDWEGSCGDNVIAPELTVDNGACDLLGYEVTSKLFEVPGDACFKMERTYHIINWCKYRAGEEPTVLARVEGEHGHAEGFTITSAGANADKGYFTYIQILKVHDDEAPVVTVVDPEPCISGIEYDALPYGEEDQTPGSAPYECDEPKTWTASATDCSDQSAITWIGRLFDANGNMVEEVESNTLTYVVSNKETYTAEFWAYDGCGNSGGARGEDIKFWDCKKPTPYVLNGIAVEIMQATATRAPMVSVWVSDLNQNSFDNCTDQSKLDMRMWHQSLGEAPTTLEGVQALPKVVDFTCEYLGTQVVNIYVIDEEENWDYAATYVIIQDNMGACGNVEPGNPDGMVAGAILNANGENVQSVSIAVNGAQDKSMTTTEDGNYMFMLEKGGDYTVTPQKDMNPLNGVSTFDLVLISKHILGISTFDTPYKYIAADVNKSGSITAFDMVQLRQLILNITSEFPNNSSWRFVESGYAFASENPAAESFNEFMSINNLNADMVDMDFVAVKVGDVNGNALANNLLGAETRNTNGTLNFNVADRFVEAGQTVTVDFTAANIATAQGYQFTMNFAGLELNEVVEGVAKVANFNTKMAQRGVLTTSWNGEATAQDGLFSLTFTANTAGLLSELISVSSDFTAAEAYNTAGELMDVNINFNSAATTAGFELNQNTPNPFKAETVIGFNLPEAGTATLKVLDVQGKVLKAIKGDYAKGYNQVSLNANELGATGVLYYQLESADNVATKKMIIIE